MSQLRIWTIRVLSLVACGIAAYLFTLSKGAGPAGCDFLSGVDCDAALASRWSVWFGVPVSLFGAIAYAGVFLSSLLVGRKNLTLDSLGWRGLELFVPLTLGAAVWFVGLQFTGATAWCPYCMAVHVCGVLIAVAALVHRWRASSAEVVRAPLAPGLAPASAAASHPDVAPPPALGAPTLIGAVGVVALLVGQVGFPPPSVQAHEVAEFEEPLDLSVGGYDVEEEDSPPVTESQAQSIEDKVEPDGVPKLPPRPKGSRTYGLLKGQLPIDTYEHPIIGSPEAPWVIAELMDYMCPNCRKFHAMAEEALKRYDGKLAIVVMPTPGDKECNKFIRVTRPKSLGGCKLARLSIAIARERPQYFEDFHSALLEGDNPPSFSQARREAEKYMEITHLMQSMGSEGAKRQVEGYTTLWAKLAQHSRIVLPCQLLEGNVVPGLPKDVDALCEIWERYLGIEPVGEYAKGTESADASGAPADSLGEG